MQTSLQVEQTIREALQDRDFEIFTQKREIERLRKTNEELIGTLKRISDIAEFYKSKYVEPMAYDETGKGK